MSRHARFAGGYFCHLADCLQLPQGRKEIGFKDRQGTEIFHSFLGRGVLTLPAGASCSHCVIQMWTCFVSVLHCFMLSGKTQFLHVLRKTTTSFIHIIFHQFCYTVFVSYLPPKNSRRSLTETSKNCKMWRIIVTKGGRDRPPPVAVIHVVKIIHINFMIMRILRHISVSPAGRS